VGRISAYVVVEDDNNVVGDDVVGDDEDDGEGDHEHDVSDNFVKITTTSI